MSTLRGLEKVNMITQPLSSVTDGFSFADQRFNCKTGSLPDSRLSDYNWPPDAENMSHEMFMKLLDDENLLNSEPELGLLGLGDPELTDPNWEPYATPRSSVGGGVNELPQQLNSQIGVENTAWCFEQDPSQALNEPVGKPSKGSNGKKRKALTQAERAKKKREADRRHRAERKMEFNRLKMMEEQLMIIVSIFGGIAEMVHPEAEDKELELEAMSHRPKHGGHESMGSILLDKVKDMVAESCKLNEIKSKLGIQETEAILEKFKEMEVDLQSLKQKLEIQSELESFPFPQSPGSRQQKEMHEVDAEDFNRFQEMMSRFGGIDKMATMLDKFHEMETALNSCKQIQEQLQPQQECPGPGSLQGGTMPELQYSDVSVDELIQKLTDDNEASKSGSLDSLDELLEGEREMVVKYKIPKPLVSTAQNIFHVYGDITKNSKYSVHVVQNMFVSFCAAIKEMSDGSLDEVTEDVIWKWRDPIMDAKRSEFDVEFAMDYLKIFAQAYFGLKATKDFDNLEHMVECLKVDEKALRKKLDNKLLQIKASETKLSDLTSEKCRICKESINKIKRKELRSRLIHGKSFLWE